MASRYRIAGAVLVALAGLVKAPAALGLLAVAWAWAPTAGSRIKALARTASVALATGIAVTFAAAAVMTLVAWLRHSPVYMLGLSLAGFALLGPAIRPWYLLWG